MIKQYMGPHKMDCRGGKEMGYYICPECRHEVHEGADSCPNCGMVFHQNQGMKKSSENKSKGLAVGIVLAIMVVLGIAAGVVYMMFSKIEIHNDGTIYLGYDGNYSLQYEGRKLSWLSSNEKVAVVTEGVITPVGEGKATITAKTLFGKTVSVDVVVASIIGEWKYIGIYIGGQTISKGDVTLNVDKDKLVMVMAGDTLESTWEYKEISSDTVHYELTSTSDGTKTEVLIKDGVLGYNISDVALVAFQRK